jgi:hypothetical protein
VRVAHIVLRGFRGREGIGAEMHCLVEEIAGDEEILPCCLTTRQHLGLRDGLILALQFVNRLF